MTESKTRVPDTVTYTDHQVITPDHAPLRQALVPSTPGDPDPVARAERALVALSGEFSVWMAQDCERLDAARKDINAVGINRQNSCQLFHISDDIKGNAATLGFTEAGPIAESLCRLLEHSPDIMRIPTQLIDQHVDAIRAVVREHSRHDIKTIGGVLLVRLRQVTDEFLLRENRERPGYLERMDSGPLSPTD